MFRRLRRRLAQPTLAPVHVYPVGDLIVHDTAGGPCPCGPSAEEVTTDSGAVRLLIVHHSLDGREFSEPDYVGPTMPTERGDGA